MAETDNFYILLDLDPSVDDWPTIETRIGEKRREWSRVSSTGLARDKLRAKQNLELIKAMLEALKEPESRRQAAKEAKKIKEAKKHETFNAIDSVLSVHDKSQPILMKFLRTDLKEYVDALGEKTVLDHIKQAGYTIEVDAPPAAEKTWPMLDKVDSQNIARNLERLGLDSLYDFLGILKSSSCEVLRGQAHEKDKELAKARICTETQAGKDLVGLALKVFKNEQEKEKHDNWLAVRKMEGLDKHIAMAAQDGILEPDEVNRLVRKAMELGISDAQARSYITARAQERNWKVLGRSGPREPDPPQCGYCFAFAKSKGAGKCWKCGEPYAIQCPHCKSSVATVQVNCTSCGLRIGDWPAIKGMFGAGKRHAAEGNVAEALQHFDQCLVFWPSYQPAVDAKRELTERHKGRERAIERIEALIRECKLMEAQACLDLFVRSEGPSGAEPVRKRIEERMTQAEAFFEKGEALRRAGKLEEAYEEYHRSLLQCADLEKTRNALALIPPPAVASLHVSAKAKGLSLRWPSVQAKGVIGYRVIRKADGSPKGPEDGSSLGEVSACSLDDVAAESGTPWYYAVYTVRAGVYSAGAARSGPHLITADVSGVILVPGNQEVVLKWTPPKGSLRVEVWRKGDAAPERSGEGQQVPVSGNGAQDAKLTNGKTYGYLLVAVYADPLTRGKDVYTAGFKALAVPTAPPPAVRNLQCSREGQVVNLRWNPIPGAIVQIRQSLRPPGLAEGTVMSVQQADTIGSLVPTLSPGSAQATLTQVGVFHFIPLSIIAGTAVVGASVTVATVNDVTNVLSHVNGPNVALTWTWPAGINEVVVCHSLDGYPDTPDTPGCSRVVCLKSEYDRAGLIQFSTLSKQPHFFTLFAKAPNAEAYSAGVRHIESMGHSKTVNYQVISRRKSLFGKNSAHLELSSTSATVVPAIVVRGAKTEVPLSINDGVLLVDAENVTLREGKGLVDIPEHYWGSGMYVRVFFKDAGNARVIRLMPAAKERLKLG